MSLSKSILIAGLALLASLPAAAADDKEPWKTPAQYVTVDGKKVLDGGAPRYIVPETPEKRMERISMSEDPGENPDPNTVFRRLGSNYTIHKFDKRWVKYTDRPGWVRPHPNGNFTEEIYQENDKWTWVWIQENSPSRTREERLEASKDRTETPKASDYLEQIRREFEPLDPPVSAKKVRFQESSQGLPREGSWRSSLAVADMNGDGFQDLVVPSQRGSESGTPSIFLGDGKGKWKRWSVKWPAKYNYGSAVAADFNKDKKMDLALGIHLSGIAVLLGDGKGGFRQVERETKFPTRKIVATDVDSDGWMDVVAIFEGPIVRDKTVVAKGYTNLRAYLNRKKGEEWKGVNLAGPKEGISGDWLSTANLNGDSHPDFVGSSLYFNATHTHYLSGEKNYAPYFDQTALTIPARGTYHAVTAGRFSSKALDDTIVASVRNWPSGGEAKTIAPPPVTEIASLDRISFSGGTPVRTPILRYKESQAIDALAHGDFDRDGNEDVIFTRAVPRDATILLGDGKGGFSLATIEGLAIAPQHNYDVAVHDVNGDKRPDVILMYESDSATAMSRKNGRIQVFLNQGAD